MSKIYRPRRSCLAVPGSSAKMLKKAQGLAADQVFLDLEDSVAPNAKEQARGNIVEALVHGDWTGKTRVVRVNDADTKWAFEDVQHIVKGAGRHLDCIMLPKVEDVSHLHWLDVLLTQLERSLGLPEGGIGIEAQIEGPSGLSQVEQIAAASRRTETIIFGPGDFMAAMQMPVLTIGASAAGHDPFDGVLLSIAVAARKYGLQAIDGPFALIHDIEGYRRTADRAAAFGFDGKWVLHPGQIEAANEVFSPRQEDYDKAELILDAYAYYTSEDGGSLGAVMLGNEMIDEASRKIALVNAEKGRRLSMKRTTAFEPPQR
ncbi:CoA ester lyase [Streptomyces sp. BV129]|uniref:HpcH/HpaI aldolase/citrate lyase family protein n=1 Tax=Streptomyces sp. BV129 TaxID=2849671 RepID=UPI001C2EEABD|nr:CoA ester lyase [Streptomyces sp. BV129]MBV1949061.1 CoA ester lyase [Streptomyces sp. BV129]